MRIYLTIVNLVILGLSALMMHLSYLNLARIEQLTDLIASDYINHKAIEERIGISVGQIEKDTIRIRQFTKGRK